MTILRSARNGVSEILKKLREKIDRVDQDARPWFISIEHPSAILSNRHGFTPLINPQWHKLCVPFDFLIRYHFTYGNVHFTQELGMGKKPFGESQA
jgi:hypothetical protein